MSREIQLADISILIDSAGAVTIAFVGEGGAARRIELDDIALARRLIDFLLGHQDGGGPDGGMPFVLHIDAGGRLRLEERQRLRLVA